MTTYTRHLEIKLDATVEELGRYRGMCNNFSYARSNIDALNRRIKESATVTTKPVRSTWDQLRILAEHAHNEEAWCTVHLEWFEYDVDYGTGVGDVPFHRFGEVPERNLGLRATCEAIDPDRLQDWILALIRGEHHEFPPEEVFK